MVLLTFNDNYHWMLIKPKCIVFHGKRKTIKYPSISISDMTNERVRTFNFLGLTLEEHLIDVERSLK